MQGKNNRFMAPFFTHYGAPGHRGIIGKVEKHEFSSKYNKEI